MRRITRLGIAHVMGWNTKEHSRVASLPDAERQREQQHGWKAVTGENAVTIAEAARPHDMVKAGLPEPHISSGVMRRLPDKSVCDGTDPSVRFFNRWAEPSGVWTMDNESIEGDE